MADQGRAGDKRTRLHRVEAGHYRTDDGVEIVRDLVGPEAGLWFVYEDGNATGDRFLTFREAKESL